jgi:hypothetical protein
VADNATPTAGQFRYNIGAVVGGTAVRTDNDTFYLNTITADSGSIPVTIWLEGLTVSVVKVFSFAKAKTGATGDPGVNLINKSIFTTDLNKGDWNTGTVVSLSGEPGATALDGFTHAMKLTTRDNYALGSIFPVTPGEVIYVAGWVNTINTTRQVNLGFRQRNLGADVSQWPTVASRAAGLGWAYISGSYTVPATGVDGLTPFIQINAFDTYGAPLVQGLYWSRSNPAATFSPTITLTPSGQAFTYTDGVASPGAQDLTFTVERQNAVGTAVFTTTPTVTLTGTGDTRTLSLANFGANIQVKVTATVGTVSDTVTVVKLNQSTAAAGATVGANWATNVTNIPYDTIHSNDDATALGFNPTFSAWSGTNPDGYSKSGTFTVSKELTIKRVGTQSIKCEVGSGLTGYQYLSKNANFTAAPLPLGTFVSGTIDIYVGAYTSGGNPGLKLRLMTDAAQSTFVDCNVAANTAIVGSWQRLPFTARVGTTQQIYGITAYLMASTQLGAFGGTNFIGTVYFDNIRFALFDSSLDNKTITINSDGSLSGAGTGAVTITGLGYTGALDADRTVTSIAAGLTMASGEINITGGAIYSNKPTYASTVAGWWMGRDGGHAKLHIGNASKYMKWDSNTGVLDIRGTLNADDIVAGRMSTSKLLVSNFSNLVENPDFELGQVGWSNAARIVSEPTEAHRGSWVMKYVSASSAANIVSTGNSISSEAGEVFLLRGWMKGSAGATGTFSLRIQPYTSAGAVLTQLILSCPAATTTWTKFEGYFTAPANTAYFVPMTYSDGVGTFYWDSISITRATDASLVVDGAITADKIQANSITASKLVLSDTTNLCPDADMSDDNAWAGSVGTLTWGASGTGTTAYTSGRYAILTDLSTSYAFLWSQWFAVEPGTELYIRAQRRVAAGTGSISGNLEYRSTLGGTSTEVWPPSLKTSSTTLAEVETAHTVPAGMRYARLRFYKVNDGATTVHVGGVIVRRKSGASLIVDGAITANKIATAGLDITAANGNNIRGGKANYASTANGWWLGWDGDTTKLALGTVSEDGTTGVGLRWTGSNLVVRGAINADDIIGGTITGRTLQTAVSGKRFKVSVETGHAEFYDTDGTSLATIGISPSGPDTIVGAFGAFNKTHEGIRAVSQTRAAYIASMTSTAAIIRSLAGTSPALQVVGDLGPGMESIGGGTGTIKLVPHFSADAYPTAPSTQGSILQNTHGLYLRTTDAAVGMPGWVDLVKPLMHLQDQKAAGASGGTFTAGAWRTRDINTVVTNNILGALNANQITLVPGNYRIEATVPGYACGQHKACLYNVTAGAIQMLGTMEYNNVAASNRSIITGDFTIAATSAFEIRHYGSISRATDGFGYGVATLDGSTNVFTDVRIWRI